MASGLRKATRALTRLYRRVGETRRFFNTQNLPASHIKGLKKEYARGDISYHAFLDGSLKMARTLEAKLESQEVKSEDRVEVYEKLINLYCEARDPEKAIFWLDSMLKEWIPPSIKVFNNIINCFAKNKDFEQVLHWRTKMEQWGHSPDAATNTAFVVALVRYSDSVDKAEELMETIREKGQLNEVNLNFFVKVLLSKSMFYKALDWITIATEDGIPITRVNQTTMSVAWLLKSGDEESLIRQLEACDLDNVKEEIIYTAMRHIYASDSSRDKILSALSQLKDISRKCNINPTPRIYGSIVRIWGKMGEAERMTAALEMVENKGFPFIPTSADVRTFDSSVLPLLADNMKDVRNVECFEWYLDRLLKSKEQTAERAAEKTLTHLREKNIWSSSICRSHLVLLVKTGSVTYQKILEILECMEENGISADQVFLKETIKHLNTKKSMPNFHIAYRALILYTGTIQPRVAQEMARMHARVGDTKGVTRWFQTLFEKDIKHIQNPTINHIIKIGDYMTNRTILTSAALNDDNQTVLKCLEKIKVQRNTFEDRWEIFKLASKYRIIAYRDKNNNFILDAKVQRDSNFLFEAMLTCLPSVSTMSDDIFIKAAITLLGETLLLSKDSQLAAVTI